MEWIYNLAVSKKAREREREKWLKIIREKFRLICRLGKLFHPARLRLIAGFIVPRGGIGRFSSKEKGGGGGGGKGGRSVWTPSSSGLETSTTIRRRDICRAQCVRCASNSRVRFRINAGYLFLFNFVSLDGRSTTTRERNSVSWRKKG